MYRPFRNAYLHTEHYEKILYGNYLQQQISLVGPVAYIIIKVWLLIHL